MTPYYFFSLFLIPNTQIKRKSISITQKFLSYSFTVSPSPQNYPFPVFNVYSYCFSHILLNTLNPLLEWRRAWIIRIVKCWRSLIPGTFPYIAYLPIEKTTPTGQVMLRKLRVADATISGLLTRSSSLPRVWKPLPYLTTQPEVLPRTPTYGWLLPLFHLPFSISNHYGPSTSFNAVPNSVSIVHPTNHLCYVPNHCARWWGPKDEAKMVLALW